MMYEVTVREHVQTVRRKTFLAQSEDDARDLAEAEDWRNWEVCDTTVTESGIEAVDVLPPPEHCGQCGVIYRGGTVHTCATSEPERGQ